MKYFHANIEDIVKAYERGVSIEAIKNKYSLSTRQVIQQLTRINVYRCATKELYFKEE